MDFALKLSTVENSISSNSDFSQLRNCLQEIFDELLIDYSSDCSNSLKKAFAVLRKVNNCDVRFLQVPSRCNITRLLENLVFCCDTVISETEKRVLFITQETDLFADADIKSLSRVFLGAIANAVKYSTGPFITVSLTERNSFAVFSVGNSGNFPIEKYFFALSSFGKTLNYISRIIASLNGRVFMNSSNAETTLTIAIPIAQGKNTNIAEIPEIDDLLFDRLSVIYEALY